MTEPKPLTEDDVGSFGVLKENKKLRIVPLDDVLGAVEWLAGQDDVLWGQYEDGKISLNALRIRLCHNRELAFPVAKSGGCGDDVL